MTETSAKPPQPLLPAYLILGDDRPKVEEALRRLKLRIVTESGTDLNVDEFSAGRHSAAEVVGAANTLAFLGGIRLVLVHDVESWRKADKDLVIAYLRSPAPDACLALVAEKLTPTDALRKAVHEVGAILEYSAPKSAGLPQWAVEKAAKQGVGLGPAEARLLVERVGDDLHLLVREIEKLGAYCEGRRVTAQDVVLLCARTLEASIFDLVDAVASGQGSAAFSAVEELYAAGERPTGLFYRILRHYQHLARAVALKEEGWPPDRIQEEMKLKPFAARKLVRQAMEYDAVRIRRAMAALADADARMKGMGTLPAELEFELVLGQLVAPR